MRGAVGAAAAAVSLLHLAGSADVAWSQGPILECRRVGEGERIHIDGVPDEQAWKDASWFSGFLQSVPSLGAAATEATSVAFLFDEANVYVAVRCDDSSPELMRANKLRHRDDPDSDDHIQIIFDTYQDQVRGWVFVVNPLGAKEEGLVAGYQRYNWDWNEVWDVATSLTSSGWQAEVRVPLRLLRYRSARQQEWAVNVKRVIRRKQEEIYIAAPPPPFDISSLNYRAILTGLELGTRQRNLQLIPYALGGVIRADDADTGEEESRTINELGFDVKYSVTSDLTLDATYNTDFAQVESDDEQVNLTRFSLFYPEKREFFLENAELFAFGQSFGGRAPDVAPFFSRRIGLYRGNTVPIDFGVRLTGKMGRQDVGILSVSTAALPEADLDSGWYNVARVRRDLGGRSHLGGIVTDSRRDGYRSTTLGVDGTWFLTEPLSLLGYYLTMDDNQGDDRASAYRLALDLTTDPWGFLFGFTEVEQGFEPDLGFVRRDGYRRQDASLRYSFRPGQWGVRRVSFRTFNNWYDSLVHSTLESRRLNLTCEVELENGDEVKVEATEEFERLFEPFDLDDDLTFEPGGYTFLGYEVSYESDRSRRWGIDASATTGEFYDGDSTQLGGGLWVVLSRHFRTAGSYSTYDVTTDHGGLDWDLWSLRLDYTHSATISASTYLQHNSSNGAAILNLRLRWILPNDSDLFIVLNERSEERVGAPKLRGRDAAVKVNYRFFL